MGAHQDHCGTFVIDPFDIEADCCMHLGEPVRPHETAEAQLTLTNHEGVRLEGVINWKLADAETGEIVDDLDGRTMPFDLDAGEQDDYWLEVVPKDSSVLHTRIQDYDDSFVATIWYALEDVRAPDEEKTRHGGEPATTPGA